MVRQLILIDDKPDQADAIEGFLRSWALDYKVITNKDFLKPAENSDVARQLFCNNIVEFISNNLSQSTEAILLDILFQQGDEKEEPLGYRLGKILRRTFPEVPIILFTVRSDLEDVTDAAAFFNFDGYIPKGTFTSWRKADHFIAALYKARLRREEVLEEFRALRQREFENTDPENKPLNPVILHISDVHYGISLGDGHKEKSYGSMLDALRRDIVENYPREGIPTPNLIVVSGDITSKGSLEGYPLAKDFLLTLSSSIGNGIDSQRVILAPGNHDVSRPLSQFGCGLDPRSELILEPGKPNGYYPYRFAPFKVFFDDFYSGKQVYRLEPSKMFTVFDLTSVFGIVIVSFNSCEQLDHSEKGRNLAYISMDTIQAAKQELIQCGIAPETPKIAVWHHPILFEDPTDPSHHKYLLRQLAKAGFKLYLHGHIHKPHNDFRPDTYASDGVYQFGAGSIGAEAGERPTDWPKHYEILAFDLDKGSCTVFSRQRVGNEWVRFASFDGDFSYHFVINS